MGGVALHQIKVPDVRYASNEDREISSLNFLAPGKLAVDWLNQSPDRKLDDAHSHLEAAAIGASLANWINGDGESSPFKEKSIERVYKGCQALGQHYSISTVICMVSESILITATYLNYYGYLCPPKLGIKLPYQDILVPLASFLLASKEVLTKQIACTRMIGYLAQSLFYLLQIFAAYQLRKVSTAAEIAFGSLNYFIAITELFQKRTKNDFLSSEDQLTFTPDSKNLIKV